MACFMCGSGISDEDAYIKKMKGMGMEVEGGNILNGPACNVNYCSTG